MRTLAMKLLNRFQPSASRHQYKTVWTDLSRTADSAKFWVQGSTDEETLQRSAAHDVIRLQKHLTITPELDMLEIGCGVGRLGTVFAPLCKTWTGCDVSPNMLKHAAQRLAGFQNVRFVELSGYDLAPVPDSSIDIVYCTVVFMHLAEWDRFNYIKEAKRVLRPGGQLHVDNISLTTDYGWKFFETGLAYRPSARPPQIGSASTPQEFEVYLTRAGFTDCGTDIVDSSWVVGWARKSA